LIQESIRTARFWKRLTTVGESAFVGLGKHRMNFHVTDTHYRSDYGVHSSRKYIDGARHSDNACIKGTLLLEKVVACRYRMYQSSRLIRP